jgi:hypothetical protein
MAIQIQPSERQSAWSGRAFNRYGNYVFNFNHPDACLSWSGRALKRYGNCLFNFNRPDACLSWSGRALNRYGNCMLKINRPDDHPPWSGCAKPYMEITCNKRATVRTTVLHRLDVALKQERFLAKISKILLAQLSVQTAHVHCPDGICTYHNSHPFEPSAYK